MKSKFAALFLLFATVFVLASCLSTDDNYTYNDDSAITSFSISSGKQYVHVKSSTGGDSLVVKDLTLSSYKFYIDQVKCEIYNPDSLPCGVNAAKLLCSVSSVNSGVVVIKNVDSDTLKYVTTTDSLDFSQDRELQVYSNSMAGIRKYKVHVNVHKEFADSFAWHAMPVCEALKALKAVRAIALGNKMLLFGTDGTQTRLFVSEGNGWNESNTLFAADTYRSVVAKEGVVYLSDGGNIMSTTDGGTWTTVATASGITRLVAASPIRLYGYAADGRLMASADNGSTWVVSTIDDELSLLPTDETAYVSMPVKTNSLTNRVLLIGTRDKSQHPTDTTPHIWGKIDEGADNSDNQPWLYYTVDQQNKHTAPMLSGISALYYDSRLLLVGCKDGEKPTTYKSLDNGITWYADTTTIVLPDDFANGETANGSAAAYAVAADQSNVLWLVNAKNGMTWRGRVNRLGWKHEQTSF